MIRVNPRAGSLADPHVAGLSSILGRGDLLVLNDSATMPASLQGTSSATRP